MDNWKNHIRDVLEAMLQLKTLVLNIVHSLNREHLEQYLCGVIDTFIYDSLEKNCEGLVVSDDDIRFSPIFSNTPSWHPDGLGPEGMREAPRSSRNGLLHAGRRTRRSL
jgi:hypothetical protein